MRSVAALLVVLRCVGFIGCKPSSPCLSGQFLLKSQCVLCHPTCSECDGHELFECTTCGVEDPEICNSCVEGYFLFRHQCRRHCPQSTYEDRGRGKYSECHTCDASCKTCFGPQALDCASCFKGYLLGPDSSCVVHCPSGSYANTATQLCEDCSPSCEACVDTSDNCISCSKGSYKLFLHQGRGLFETAEGSCDACDGSCLSCDGIKSQCLSCADGHYLESGTCRLNCSLRTYPADDATCRRCAPHCDVCSDDRTCFKCSFLYLMLNGVCKASCPMGYYEDMEEGRCGQCHPTCGSCSGPLADDCETCSTFSPKLYKGTCSKHCPVGTYYETEALECQECHQTCMSCSGSEANQCTQCEKGLVLDPNTMLCGVTGDTDCPPRTYLHDDQFTCMRCHQHCYSCEGPGNDECQTTLKHASAGLPVALLLALALALAVFALLKAHSSKRLCWAQSYERLSGSASVNMPHGVPEPDSGDEVDVVYTSRGGSVYRRYSFIHEQDADASPDVDESTCLNQS
ncbi:Proprotein convertase subtilisin/kexin type 5 [Liparis tanakae]|uniref:Proprotein convertase subtilisin/kexin type 5 n=1 Tax=Liparis tanakae TaxID=230148 RepID=A0A4Z2FZ31_9TELE|nr:Proprotein convertase subtilisin/kexin type 5 [Liparis tanakae]